MAIVDGVQALIFQAGRRPVTDLANSALMKLQIERDNQINQRWIFVSKMHWNSPVGTWHLEFRIFPCVVPQTSLKRGGKGKGQDGLRREGNGGKVEQQEGTVNNGGRERKEMGRASGH